MSDVALCVSEVGLRSVRGPAMALAADGGAWVAWQCDDTDGPEGGVRARQIGADGAVLGGEIAVARGARGGFASGGVVALPDGGAAVAFRGDEGMAWVARLGPDGRLRRTCFLEACEGAPSLVHVEGETVAVATVRAGHGVVVHAVTAAREPREWFTVERADAPSLAGRGGRVWLACRVDGEVRVRAADDAMSEVLARPNARVRAHVPSLATSGSRWACAWIGEDTGKMALFASVSGGNTARVAEVWAPLERPWASAPSLIARGEQQGWWVAWREERGPRPAVYLRGLESDGRRDEGREWRVNAREAKACAGRVGLAADARGGWWCAFAESSDAGEAVRVQRGG